MTNSNKRKPATNFEFNKLRDDLFQNHNLFVAVRGRKFAPIEAGTVFEFAKHTNHQIRDIANAYGSVDIEETFDGGIDDDDRGLDDARSRGIFGVAFIAKGSFKRFYYVTDINLLISNPKNNNINIKHYNDVCKEN